MRETTLQTPKSVKKEGEEVLEAPEWRFFPCGADHGEAGCPAADHGGPQRSRYPPADRGAPHTKAVGCPKEAVTPWRAHAAAGSWQDLRTSGEAGAHTGVGLLAGLVTLWGTHTGAACS